MSVTSSDSAAASTRYTTHTAGSRLFRATGGSGRFYTNNKTVAMNAYLNHGENLSTPKVVDLCRFLNLHDVAVFDRLERLGWVAHATNAGMPDVDMPITLKDGIVWRTSTEEWDQILLDFLEMHWATIEAWCGCPLDGYEWNDGNVSFHHEIWFVNDPIVAGVLHFPHPSSPVPQYVRQSSPLKRSPLGLDAYATCRPSPTKQRRRFQESVFDLSRKLF